ncbi:anticodon-binding protein [Nonomuraea sp. NPDC050556]|uniref:anticodon-binding protein n=1 Tax=Nonomuraea sp. NPDC050556 TaxID=3364369 RepID=UPI0037B8480C
MSVRRIADVLGEPPIPQGTWEREATFVSSAAMRRPVDLGQLRAIPGVTVATRTDGMLVVTLKVPGALVEDVEPLDFPDPWPDFPRTWDNPGFVVRYAAERACNVQRWARELGVPGEPFVPELLDHPCDRAVLRALAEVPGRRVSRSPGWDTYLVRLALAFHDAHEHAPAIPKGDETPERVHTARVRLARAVGDLLQNIRAEG